MKPKNKFQKQIVEASKRLPKITQAQVKWGYQNCIEHIGRRTKKGVISCLECGHQWTNKTTEAHCTCPVCNTKLVINDTRLSKFSDYQYLCIVTACKGFQVLRFIYIEYKAKAGQKAYYHHLEVVQRWIAPDGRHVTMAKLRPMGYFAHGWCFGGYLEIRPEKALYNITPTLVYPRQKLIPEVQRSGFTGDFHKLTPFDFFKYLLSDNRAETLLKARYIELFQHFALRNSDKINSFWPSIRICIRNGYKINDATTWCDYIDLLRFFSRDLHNAKYVCPADLTAQHDRYVEKKAEDDARLEMEKQLEKENEYREAKAKFFGLMFSDGLISVRVLESVKDIIIEGKMMHHCVGSYHSKTDSLILSACIDGKRIETIEVSLSKLQVIQCRGACNKETQYHKRIIQLVGQNMPLIEKRIAA